MTTKPLFLIPSDPLFHLQWHLLNTGNTPGSIAGQDINVIRVWPDYTGKGVLIGMDDHGIDETHPDLVQNYRPDLSWDSLTGWGGAGAKGENENHGTSVAGLMVADHNGMGGVGVAWDAELAAIRADISNDSPYPPFVTYPMAVEHMLESGVHIVNNSWGTTVALNDTEYQFIYHTALERAATYGREGLGLITLFSSGNERVMHMNASYDSGTTSPFAIVVGASDQAGNMAGYSTAGASVLISAPGSFPATMVTTDRQGEQGYNKTPGEAGNYTDIPGEGFNGTSAAAPVASGVVALMLEANPGLGYRDVQEILAYSAKRASFVDRPDTLYAEAESVGGYEKIREQLPEIYEYLAREGDLLDYNFNGARDWNGGGLMQGHVFGYGHIDALAAVRMAEAWHKVSTIENILESEAQILQTRARLAPGETREVRAQFSDDLRVEQVLVSIHLKAEDLNALQLELVSPAGTVSRLISNPPEHGQDPSAGKLVAVPLPTELEYTLNSVRHWGEDLAGTWTLRLSNLETGDMVFLEDWSIDAVAAPHETTQFFTDEFAYFAELQPERTQITAAHGVDLNAVMVTSPTVFNLATGEASVAGISLSVDHPDAFRNLLTGDGDDTLIGNGLDNMLLAGRGNNFIDGGAGFDIVRFVGHRAYYEVVKEEDGLRVDNLGLSGGGSDQIRDVELLRFSDEAVLANAPEVQGELLFDEAAYLRAYADVAQAVSTGELASALHHYEHWGHREGRNPNDLFDESWYLERNADVAAAVENGIFDSGYAHYLTWGWAEGRSPAAWMDVDVYLVENPDVAQANVNPMSHYLLYGYDEGRGLPSWPAEFWV